MMTPFTSYSPDTSSPSDDWFSRVIAPETSTIERSRQYIQSPIRKTANNLLLAGVLASGLSGQPVDLYLPEPSSTNGHAIAQMSQTAQAVKSAVGDSPEKAAVSDPVSQLLTVQTRFGLTKVGLARACRVERQTVYDWYNDKFVPMGDNARRLDALFRIADSAQRRGIPTLDPRLAGKPLSTGNTLPDLLAAVVLDPVAIDLAVDELAQLETARQSRSARSIRERLGWKEPSEEQQIANLNHNLGRRSQG